MLKSIPPLRSPPGVSMKSPSLSSSSPALLPSLLAEPTSTLGFRNDEKPDGGEGVEIGADDGLVELDGTRNPRPGGVNPKGKDPRESSADMSGLGFDASAIGRIKGPRKRWTLRYETPWSTGASKGRRTRASLVQVTPIYIVSSQTLFDTEQASTPYIMFDRLVPTNLCMSGGEKGVFNRNSQTSRIQCHDRKKYILNRTKMIIVRQIESAHSL